MRGYEKMVWYNLKVGIWNLKITPLSPIKKEYENVDKNGEPLIRVSGKFERGHYLNEVSGEKHDRAFKLIIGSPRDKISKTKEVNVYKEVDLKEVEDILEEKRYLVESETLLKELDTTKKALKFGYASGNGYKVYKAYLYPSKIYDGFLMLVLGTTQVSELVSGIMENQDAKQKAKIEISISGVDKAQVEDLIEL